MTKADYYSLLGVSREATPEELKKAYRKKAVEFHPDKHKGDKGMEAKFKEISEAYEVLKDPEKRAAYDRYGHAAFESGRARSGGAGGFGGFHDPFDLFREVFGGGGGGGGFEDFFGGGGGGSRQGEDLRYDLEISLVDAFRGTEKSIRYRAPVACKTCSGSGAEPGASITTCSTCGGAGRVVTSRGFFQVQQACPACGGQGRVPEKLCSTCSGEGRVTEHREIKVRIPAGIETGQKLRSAGNGAAGPQGTPAGDLLIVIHVRAHDLFDRQGDDLYCDIPIKFTLAALGGSIEVPTLSNTSGLVNLKIPAGTQDGTVFKLRDRGMPHLRGGGNGNQFVRVHIEVPRKLTSDQKKHLEAFALASGDSDEPVSKSFWDKAKRIFE